MPLAKTWRAEPTSSMAAGAGRPETVRAARDANDEYDLGEPNAGSAAAPVAAANTVSTEKPPANGAWHAERPCGLRHRQRRHRATHAPDGARFRTCSPIFGAAGRQWTTPTHTNDSCCASLSVDAGDLASAARTFCAVWSTTRSPLITLTRFDSVAAIQTFADDNYGTSVLQPQALALLARERSSARGSSPVTFESSWARSSRSCWISLSSSPDRSRWSKLDAARRSR
jgi:hypothetical protein